MISVNKDSLK